MYLIPFDAADDPDATESSNGIEQCCRAMGFISMLDSCPKFARRAGDVPFYPRRIRPGDMTMPSFVPGFTHDVFVSYAHVDNRKFGRESGWVETLVENLREGLLQQLGRGQPDIWRDPHLSSSEPFSEAIRDAVTHAATLLVILSKSYLTSEWCRQELALFLESAEQTGGARGRIFLVRLDTLDHTYWPAAFNGLLGQQFFEQATSDAPAHTLGTPAANDPEQGRYFRRLDDLSGELAKKLLQMKQAADHETPPEPPPPNNSPAVFLAEATPDLDDLRDNIRRYLNQANIRVLPETYYDRTPQAFRTAMAADLDQSMLFVQLLGLYVGPKTSDLPKGYEGLQLDVVEEKGLPILRWHDPALNVASARDQTLLERKEVMVMAFEEFKREIVNAVKKRQAEQKVAAISGGGVDVLINANSRDDKPLKHSYRRLSSRALAMIRLMKTKASSIWSNNIPSRV